MLRISLGNKLPTAAKQNDDSPTANSAKGNRKNCDVPKNKTNAGSNTPWAYVRESLQRNVYAQFSYFGAFATTRSPDQKKDTPRSRAETK